MLPQASAPHRLKRRPSRRSRRPPASILQPQRLQRVGRAPGYRAGSAGALKQCIADHAISRRDATRVALNPHRVEQRPERLRVQPHQEHRRHQLVPGLPAHRVAEVDHAAPAPTRPRAAASSTCSWWRSACNSARRPSGTSGAAPSSSAGSARRAVSSSGRVAALKATLRRRLRSQAASSRPPTRGRRTRRGRHAADRLPTRA